MSWNNDWLKNGLPTFSGGKDKSIARTMIDGLGGPQGFKTAYRTNADGSITMVQLKGAMPPQVTTVIPVTPIVVSVPRIFVGERMRDYGGSSPSEAYSLTVDFSASTVTKVEIPLATYLGTDGGTDWKKYRRGLRWTSTDGSAYVDYAFSGRYAAASRFLNGGSVYYLFDGHAFIQEVESAASDSDGYAKITADVYGTPKTMFVNTVRAIDATTGELIPSYVVGAPDGYSENWTGRALTYIFRSPAGTETLYGGVRLKVREGVYGVPGTYLFTDGSTSHSVVDTLVATGLTKISYDISAVKESYTSYPDTGLPKRGTTEVSSSGSHTQSESTRFPMGGHFVDDTAVPVSVTMSFSTSGTSKTSVTTDSYGDNTSYRWVTSTKTTSIEASASAEATIAVSIGGVAGYSESTGFSRVFSSSSVFDLLNSISISSSESIIHSEIKFVEWSMLSAPESRVYALVLGRKIWPGLDICLAPTTLTVTYELTFVIVDVDNNCTTSHTVTETAVELYEQSVYSHHTGTPPSGAVEVYAKQDSESWHTEGTWTTSVSAEAVNPIIVTQNYTYTPYSPVSLSPASTPFALALDRDGEQVNSSAICGGIYAGSDTILVSARNPKRPDQKLSLAIDRATGKKIAFDHGFGYELLYKALKDIP